MKTLIIVLCLTALLLVGTAILTAVKKIYEMMGVYDRNLSEANHKLGLLKGVLRGVEHLIAQGAKVEKSSADLAEASHRLEEALRDSLAAPSEEGWQE